MIYAAFVGGQTPFVPIPDDLFTMGDVVLKLRKRHGWTQQQLADKAHLSVAAVKGLERYPHRSSRQTIAAIAGALGLREVDLIGYEKRLEPAADKGHVRRVAGKLR